MQIGMKYYMGEGLNLWGKETPNYKSKLALQNTYYETSFRIKLASRNGNLFRYFVIFDIK